MTVNALKPVFKNRDGYKKYIEVWKTIQAVQTERSRNIKREAKNAQKANKTSLQNEARYEKIIGRKMMGILEEAKERMKMINELEQSIKAQNEKFPVTFENVRQIEFHFNKKHLEFPDIMPMWVIKFKGQSFYVNHVDCETPWTTRENPDHPSTKGSIRVQRGNITINSDGSAVIN